MPSLITGEHIQVVYDRRVIWEPAENKTQLAGAREWRGQQGEEEAASIQPGIVRENRSDFGWLNKAEGTQGQGNRGFEDEA